MSELPLAGELVLDMTRLLPGNFATVTLVEMGAANRVQAVMMAQAVIHEGS